MLIRVEFFVTASILDTFESLERAKPLLPPGALSGSLRSPAGTVTVLDDRLRTKGYGKDVQVYLEKIAGKPQIEWEKNAQRKLL